jgi:hypothetical protein
MRISVAILFILFKGFIPLEVNAQINLVPNNSFEIIDTCPLAWSQLYLANPWFQPSTYFGNVTNSCNSDLYNICPLPGNSVHVPTNGHGYQIPRTGNGYCGIYCSEDTLDGSEYIEVQLNSSLIPGQKYCVEFYVSLSEHSIQAISNIGVYFSIDSLLYSGYGVINVVPQIENDSGNVLYNKISWTKIFGTFVAGGNERFLTIGNFKTFVNSNVQYFFSGGTSNSAYYYIDDISVIACDTTLTGTNVTYSEKTNFNVFPNPNNGRLNFTYHLKGNDKGGIIFYDIDGHKIITHILDQNTDLLSIEDNSLKNGVYIYKVFVNGELIKTDRIVLIK